MFSKEITSSDAFLSMTYESQVLYFQLVMGADNRGYINKARSIISMFDGISFDNLKELVAKKFILDRGNGLYLIKHWYIHNDIPTYMAEESNYIEDLSTLYFDSNFAYTEKQTENSVFSTIKGKGKHRNEKKKKLKRNENEIERENKDINVNNSKGYTSCTHEQDYDPDEKF